MTSVLDILWLVPLLPLAAALVLAFLPESRRGLAGSLAVGALAPGFLIACAALSECLTLQGVPAVRNGTWFEFGITAVRLGWVLDPLSAVMLVMVTFVGSCIFVFSAGYLARDPNLVRFYCYLSLFAAAMLGVVLSNSLLLVFICWEIMGLASYLLIGFWAHKPSAAAAAKKAFITTRIGDVGFFLGMLWLYSETGTLLFYDQGAGCMETTAVARLAGQAIGAGMVASTGICLLLFLGAIGKSGQLPLHVWLPDAMEGPTPVSALIHAATMVAAGVFLMARVHPLASAVALAPPAAAHSAAHAPGGSGHVSSIASKQGGAAETTPSGLAPVAVPSATLKVMAWVGAVTALFAALIAVAQTDIKRILAYSTVSQLGMMFLGLATGGVAVGMFHLITHAVFKALLFLGAGSLIHGCQEEQDIRLMGGLRRWMPLTFLTYAVGMMALSGVPLFFSGFWSKDEILHSAALWSASKWPWMLAVSASFLTAFYMTRQMIFVFWGGYRGDVATQNGSSEAREPHESPMLMTLPLAVLAACAVLLSVFGTPMWPWFHGFMSGHPASVQPSIAVGVLATLVFSGLIVAGGIFSGWWVYGRVPAETLKTVDPLESFHPSWFCVLRDRFHIDELYSKSFIAWHQSCGVFCDWLDRKVLGGMVDGVRMFGLAVAWVGRLTDEFVVNLGVEDLCTRLRGAGTWISLFQNGQVQRSLRLLAAAAAALAFWVVWK